MGFAGETFVIKLVLSIICGFLIGLEREAKDRPAGLRTHMIVCIASMLVMTIGIMQKDHYITISPNSSSTRMAAQIISGIGFLGAGTIIQGKDTFRGLTTAATLWAVACIGIAIGATYYFEAIVTTVAILIVLILINVFENRYHIRKSQYIYELEISEPFDNLKNLRKNLTFYKVRVNYINIIGREDTEDGGKFTVEVSLHLNPDYHRNEIDPIQIFDNLPYVKSIKMQRLPHDCLDNNHH